MTLLSTVSWNAKAQPLDSTKRCKNLGIADSYCSTPMVLRSVTGDVLIYIIQGNMCIYIYIFISIHTSRKSKRQEKPSCMVFKTIKSLVSSSFFSSSYFFALGIFHPGIFGSNLLPSRPFPKHQNVTFHSISRFKLDAASLTSVNAP